MNQDHARSWIPALLIAAMSSALVIVAVAVFRDTGAPSGPSIEAAPRAEGESVAVDASKPDEDVANRGEVESPTPQRKKDEFDPLALPDRAERRRLAEQGRGVFCGVVFLPDGTPCPGATVFFRGEAVATTDERGRYRFEFEDPFPGYMNDCGPVAAVKPGVGAGMADPEGDGPRADIVLMWESRISGTVIESVSRKPVPSAFVEMASYVKLDSPLHNDLLRQETFTADDGSFEFVGFAAPGEVHVRGTADCGASDGWMSYLAEDGDRCDVTLEIEPIIRIRGRFSPWPPRSLPDPAMATDARVRMIADEGRSDGPRNTAVEAVVDSEGRFEGSLPSTMRLDLLLVAGTGALWHEEVEVSFPKRDVDLGRIVLDDCVALTGVVGLPTEVLELGCRVSVWANPWSWDRPHWFLFPVDRAGRFRAEPLPPGRIELYVILGGESVIEISVPDSEPGEDSEESEEGRIEPGTVYDCGRLVPEGGVIAGRITGPEGRAAPAQVRLMLRESSGEDAYLWGGTTESGVYALLTSPSRREFIDGLRGEAIAESETSWIWVRSAGVEGEADLPELPEASAAIRRDIRCDRTHELEGILVDHSGVPLEGCFVMVQRDPASGTTPRRFAYDRGAITNAEGKFLIQGLDDAVYRASTGDDEDPIDLGPVRPGPDRVTLVVPSGE